MRAKKRKPPICIGGSEQLRAIDRHRYMNVPSPAPCHVNVAGVGKQSVWGLRIMTRTQLSLWNHFSNSSIQEWLELTGSLWPNRVRQETRKRPGPRAN